MPFPLPTYYSVDIRNKNAIEVADGICEGIIPSVSGRIINFTGDWDLKSEEYRLVTFKLNSFRWLLDLSDAYKLSRKKKYIDKGFEYIKDWQGECGALISGDKWNAYVIAERITNWIGFVSEYGNEKQRTEMAGWIYSQARELRDSIEYQLGANHLLSEAKALVYAGLFLKIDELYEYGKKVLYEEAKEQFFTDGGHYEQSVSYHVEALQQFFEAYAVLKQRGDDGSIASLVSEPYQFLNGMIGVNGKIPLFNDSAYDYPFYDAADFLSTAMYIYGSLPPNGRVGEYSKRWEWLGNGNQQIDWKTKILYEITGFVHYIFEIDGKRYSFFMDCGNNGPDYNLGHAHADALSVLLYTENKEILVDSGVFTYQPGDGRNECRGTKAHNTVEVDEMDNAEVWAAFRVAKRGHTELIESCFDDGLKIRASYDGYVKRLPDSVIHTREVEIKDKRIVIQDLLEYENKHRTVSRFHVSPRCSIIKIDSNTCEIDGNITVQAEMPIRIVDCKVAGFFGKQEEATCIEIDFSGKSCLKTVFSIE